MIFSFTTDDPSLMKNLEFISKLATEIDKLRTENNSKDKTIDSLVKEKYTKYGDGCGFLATDSTGTAVWVNSVNIALEQKDKEIEELWAKLEAKMNIKVKRKRIFIVLTCTLGTLLIAVISAAPMYFHKCEVMPVADRQRMFYELGYLEYDGIDGICGEKTHFAQRLYEHDWSAVKEWKARQE